MRQYWALAGKAGTHVFPLSGSVRFKMMVFIAAVLSLFFSIPAELHAAGQVQKISIHTKGQEPLTSVFRTIEKNSIYLFNYQDKDVAGIKVSVSMNNAAIENVMKAVLDSTGLVWQIKGKNIIVSAARQQPSGPRKKVTIHGKVLDADGQPVPGAGVLDQAGKTGTVTDIDGTYSMSTTEGAVLLYSCSRHFRCHQHDSES